MAYDPKFTVTAHLLRIIEEISVYREQTTPLTDYYRGKGNLKETDGLGPMDEIQGRILKAIGVA